MTSSQTKKASGGAQETNSTTKDASRYHSSSKKKNADEGAEDVKIIKNPKNINYYHSLEVEDLGHVEEPDPELELIDVPKPNSATTTEFAATSQAKKRRERRTRNAIMSRGAGDDEGDDLDKYKDSKASAAIIRMIDQLNHPPVEAIGAAQKDFKPLALGAFLNSGDDDEDNISELDLDDDDDKNKDAISTPADPTSPSTTTPPANDEAVLAHTIKINEPTAFAEADKALSTRKDDIALFGGYACLILACYAQHGLGQISAAQVLLLVGTAGVCVPLEWFAEVVAVGETKSQMMGRRLKGPRKWRCARR